METLVVTLSVDIYIPQAKKKKKNQVNLLVSDKHTDLHSLRSLQLILHFEALEETQTERQSSYFHK